MDYYVMTDPIKVNVDTKEPIYITNHNPGASSYGGLRFSIRKWWADADGTLKPGKGISLPQDDTSLWNFMLDLVNAYKKAGVKSNDITDECIRGLISIVNDSNLDDGIELDLIAIEQREIA